MTKFLGALVLVILFAGGVFAQALQIDTSVLAGGVPGTAYLQTLVAEGGSLSYTWSNTGVLPTGLTLHPTGVIDGTPTAVGTFSFTVTVTDTTMPTAQTASRPLSIIITIPPTITTTTLPNGATGVVYSPQTLTAANGSLPYTWSVPSGSLPPGLTLSTDGIISGTPSAEGTFNFNISIADSSVPSFTASKALAITIQAGVTITTPPQLPLGAVGVFYSQTVQATGPSSLTWSVVGGTLPPGLGLSNGGALSGTPGIAGTFDFTFQAAASNPPQTARQAFHLVINPALTITAVALPDATLSSPYSVTLAATGGLGPYTWSNPSRGLPPGLSLSASGIISGTPTALGPFAFAVQVTDSFTPVQTASRNFTINVASTLTITTTLLPSAIQNLAYSQQLQVAGGTNPFTWVLAGGTLPSGLTLSSAGLLQGTPTALGSQTITVSVTDSHGASSARNLVLVVEAPVTVLSVPNLPSTINPTQQLPIQLLLPAARISPLTGKLTLSFTSKAEVPSDDPMTRFSTGSRILDFTFPANTTTAVFSSDILLLAGTVAGTISLTASFQNGLPDVAVASTDILPLVPQITNVLATRTTGGLDVQITGYASARRVTNVEFIFDVKVGSAVQQISLSRSVDADFAAWYRNAASSAFGSAFSFLQSFTIQDSSVVQAVTVRLTNAQGSTTSSSVPFK